MRDQYLNKLTERFSEQFPGLDHSTVRMIAALSNTYHILRSVMERAFSIYGITPQSMDVLLALYVMKDRRCLLGEIGELLIRSPACLTEYLNQPDETRAVLDGGWFRTGDLATLSVDGLVRIVGRKKEIILRGGYTVAAGEVEAVLMTHPEVAEAAVIGVPHAELGEEIRAYVALRPGARTAAEDIVAWCKARVANYKYPREVRLCADLPRGPTGKVDKARLPA